MRMSVVRALLLASMVLAAAGLAAATTSDDQDTVMVEVQDYYGEDGSLLEADMGASWAGLDSPPLETMSEEQAMLFQQSESVDMPQTETGPVNDMSPKADIEEIGAFTAEVPADMEDHALLEAEMATTATLPAPTIDFNGRVEYTVSYELYIPHLRGNWANIFSRGASDSDRTPAMWTYPSGSRIHFRHASTRSWNDGVDSATSGPVGRWFPVKAVVKHNRAWIYIDGVFDNFVDLGPHHRFTWGQRSSLLRTNGEVNPYYSNTMQIRNWVWSNVAEELPSDIPQPDFNGPVRYTVEFDLFVDKPYHGYRNMFLRGAHNGDRTPGFWTYPHSTRIHWRHAATHDWNLDLDPSWAPPFGQWYSFKGVINHNKAWCYINGMLDRVVDLSQIGQHFTWGTKSIGLLKGPAVHPSYAPAQMRNFKWTNSAEEFPGIAPDFSKPPQFSMSFEMKIPQNPPRHHWPSLFVRGTDNGDRSPGLWYMAGNRGIHIRFGSTYTWNTDLDTTTPSPLGRWFELKLIMDKTKAWVYVDGKLDRFVELPQGHSFRWNGRSLSFARGASVHPAYHNSNPTRIRMRNFRYSNTVEQLPLALPKPNFNGPVDYSMEVQVMVPHTVPNWGCIMNRGRDNGDRTPGIWTFPGSTRIHVRHTSTYSSNTDCDSVSAAPQGEWFTLKTVFNHNRCQTYINGRLDRDVTLPNGYHFTWGSRSLGWAHGGAVHGSYYDVQTRGLRFSPNTTTEAFTSPLENPPVLFWANRARPTDQTRPAKLPLFLPPAGVKAPKMVKKVRAIKKPKVVNPANARVLAVGELAKPKKPAPAPVVAPVKVAPAPTKPVIINPMSGKSTSGKAVPPANVKAPKPAPLIIVANLNQFRPDLAAAKAKMAALAAAKAAKVAAAAKAAKDKADAERRRMSEEERRRHDEEERRRAAENASRSAAEAARDAARARREALAAKLEARRQKLLAEDSAEDAHREARRKRKAAEFAAEQKAAEDLAAGKVASKAFPSGFLAGPKSAKAGAAKAGSTEDTVNQLGLGHGNDGGVGEASFVNGFWVGKYAPKHTNRERKLCPDCQPIIYNKDSPLSDDDLKLLRKQHADLVLGGVILHSQSTLDRATLMVDDAEAAKKALLDKYPTKDD